VKLILVGDSTIASGTGYGDALCARLPQASCINLAKRGRSSGSFRQEGHWDAALALLKDARSIPSYVLIQFGHNDQPGKGVHSTDLVRQFPANMARYAREVTALGGVPVLVTPLTRRGFKGAYLKDDLAPWAQATRRVAQAEQVHLIDLNRISGDAVQTMGQTEADSLAEAPPGQPRFDRTHLGTKGAALFSGMVATELARLQPSLALFLRD
jgi:lysophospholipase L1-like esterase